jgi:hypothetical protein
MVMTESQKAWIDGATYEQLLSRWRSAPVGDPMFADDTGKYYTGVMAAKRQEVGDTEHVRASKAIGW